MVRSPFRTPTLAVFLLSLIAVGCGGADEGAAPVDADPPTPSPGLDGAALGSQGLSPEQEAFWGHLEDLCGGAFVGTPVEAPDDSDWWEAELVMHVRECEEEEIRIPLHVNDDRSRTWVVTRTADGLRLKHDHRLRDGTPDASNTEYGGDTRTPGSEVRQEFPADAYSIGVVPARESQFWFLEVRPDDVFVYGLLREATGLAYRVEFDLTAPVEPPPAPWGF
ncbi:MAG: hypothetical protein EA422_02695 [Gemmatimonadales bacterium]|nr:MAG: hypothetical protein EA422_02695 [Gemmatimonadales bacterium]